MLSYCIQFVPLLCECRSGCRSWRRVAARADGRLQAQADERTARRDAVADVQQGPGADRQRREADLQVRRSRPTRRFDKDYCVFVHVLDPDGEQMWTDDHCRRCRRRSGSRGRRSNTRGRFSFPTIRTSARRSCGSASTTRPSGNRLTLNAPRTRRAREYVVTKFQLLPSVREHLPDLRRTAGTRRRSTPKNPPNEWQWTKKTATLSFRNPKKDSTFYLEYDARPDLFNPPQQVTLTIGDETIGDVHGRRQGPEADDVPDHRRPARAPATWSELRDRRRISTFTPGGGDPRELGIRVFHAFVEPK